MEQNIIDIHVKEMDEKSHITLLTDTVPLNSFYL